MYFAFLRIYYYYKKNKFHRFVYWLLQKYILKHNKIIKLSFLASLISFFIYTIGYIFLYGFLFGGTGDKPTSLLEIFINPVPINFYSVIIVGIFIVLCCIFCFVIIYFIRTLIYVTEKRNKPYLKRLEEKVVLFIVFGAFCVLLHFGVSTFFVNSLSIDIYTAKFAVIWIAPLLLFVFGYYMINAPKYWLPAISGILTGFYIGFIVVVATEHHSYRQLIIAIYPFFILLMGCLFILLKDKHKNNRLIEFIIMFPVFFLVPLIIQIIINGVLHLAEKTNFALLIILNCIITFLFVLKEKNKNGKELHASNTKNLPKKKNTSISKKNLIDDLKIFLIFIPIILMFITTILPFGIMRSSIFVRDIASYSSSKLGKLEKVFFEYDKLEINFNDDIEKNDKNKNYIEGIVVAEKNGYMYVSSNWKLVRINSKNIITIK